MKQLLRTYQSWRTHWVGDGFPVRSVFDYNGLGKDLSPFVLLDYVAPYEFPPTTERRGVGAHPHKGFETVTVAFQGEIEHRDSSGGGGKIGPGDVQWMTAGSGIVHEEFQSEEFIRKGGVFQMVQLWVNLRAQDKNTKPHYQNLLKADIPVIELPEEAGTVRVIAGEYNGSKGPAKTFTRINLWEVNLRKEKSTELPLRDGHTSAFLVLSGEVAVSDQDNAAECDLAVFTRSGSGINVTARKDAKLLVMDGEPIVEPVVGRGPFVMNTYAEIQQAFEDYQFGRMGEISTAMT
jgi:redox-sensitive bicupin YhaK (pirin superfamily)